MKNAFYFAVAVAFALVTMWMFSLGASSAQPVAECGLVNYMIAEGPECGWTRAALYGTKASLAFVLLFTLIGLINRRHASGALGMRPVGSGFGAKTSNEFG